MNFALKAGPVMHINDPELPGTIYADFELKTHVCNVDQTTLDAWWAAEFAREAMDGPMTRQQRRLYEREMAKFESEGAR